ncbi:hypothetical protein [Rubritalea tangerina]|uniref:hypothetical protein n=1 Tax=Rubritalea tangerina TaxID=430798 RepID=UPI00360669A9
MACDTTSHDPLILHPCIYYLPIQSADLSLISLGAPPFSNPTQFITHSPLCL